MRILQLCVLSCVLISCGDEDDKSASTTGEGQAEGEGGGQDEGGGQNEGGQAGEQTEGGEEGEELIVPRVAREGAGRAAVRHLARVRARPRLRLRVANPSPN